MGDNSNALYETIGWQRAVSWGVGVAMCLCSTFAGVTYSGLQEELRSINKKLDIHGERIAVEETKSDAYKDQLCTLEKRTTDHLMYH